MLGSLAASPNRATEPGNEQPAAAGLSFLTGSDFSGAEMSSTKEQRGKVRDGNQREAGTPVFRDAYYAQLREIHGGNMRATEAMEDDDEDLTGRWRRNRAMDPDKVNDLMKRAIQEIAADGELVTKEKVKNLTTEV